MIQSHVNYGVSSQILELIAIRGFLNHEYFMISVTISAGVQFTLCDNTNVMKLGCQDTFGISSKSGNNQDH